MFNQKTVIYIILSAILLYLYYKRGGVALFVAFIVVVAGTLFAGASASEGFSLGGGKGGDKQCAKLGFATPKIDKNKMTDGITKSLKNIQKVADKNWPFEDYIGNKPTNDKAKDNYSEVTENVTFKTEGRKIENDKVTQENVYIFLGHSVELYEAFKKDENIDKTITKITDKLANGIKGGNEYLSLLRKNHQFLKKEYKAAGVEDKGVLKLSQYLLCLCTQWLSIWKQIQNATGGSEGGDDGDAGDDAGDDEEEKPKKKKKTTKKKSKKTDDDDGEE